MMSRKAKPTAIGGFAVGAVLLIVVAIGVFGSGRLFQERLRFVMFFEGSVQGLQVGAPVMLRGVEIGQVVELSAVYNQETTEIQVPVIVETIEKRVVYEEGMREGDPMEAIRRLIDDRLGSLGIPGSAFPGSSESIKAFYNVLSQSPYTGIAAAGMDEESNVMSGQSARLEPALLQQKMPGVAAPMPPRRRRWAPNWQGAFGARNSSQLRTAATARPWNVRTLSARQWRTSWQGTSWQRTS